METWKREYGSNGKLSKESGYYSDGTLYMIRLFAYDTNGHNSSIEILEKPFTTGNQLLYTYNSRGDVLTETYFDRLRDIVFSVNEYGYTYDSNNRLIEFIKNTSFDKVEYTKWVNTYDEEGRIIKQDMYRSNKFDGPYEQVAVINFTYTYSR